MGNEVRLVDLEVIKRYSLAVRQESAEAEDLLAALDASREAVLACLPPVAQPEPEPDESETPTPAPTTSRRRRRRSAS